MLHKYIDPKVLKTIEEGTPAKWKAEKLRDFKNVSIIGLIVSPVAWAGVSLLFGLVSLFTVKSVMVAVIYGVITLYNIFSFCKFCRRLKGVKKPKGEFTEENRECVPEKKSALFGMNYALDVDYSKKFKTVYGVCAVIVYAVCSALIFSLSPLDIAEDIIFIPNTWAVVLAGYFAVQLSVLISLKSDLLPYVCADCGWANCVRYKGDENTRRSETTLSRKRGGDEYRTGTVYVDGKEVGGVYGRSSEYRETSTVTHYNGDSVYVCEHCGRKVKKRYKQTFYGNWEKEE